VTATDAEIREWARDRGMEVSVRGKLATDVRAEYEAAHPSGSFDDVDDEIPFVLTLPDEDDAPAPGSGAPSTAPSPEPASPRREEVRPQGKKVSAAERFRQRTQTTRKPNRKRVSVETIGGFIWNMGAMLVSQVPSMVPAGRAMALQADTSGVIIEDIVRGTVVDRLLQPLARGGESAEKTFGLLGLPVLTMLVCANPGLYEPLKPAMKMALMVGAHDRADAAKKLQRRAESMADDFGADAATLDAVIESLFSFPVPSEDEEEAIRRASGNG
jgi:hypothetical protein